MKKFKDLSREEKIDEALNYRAWRHYRNIKARYLIALRNNDITTLEYFENMGGHFRQIIENTYEFERAKLCGFTEPIYDEFDWASYRLDIVKEIEVCKSRIRIAKTPSGKFVCGVDHSTGNAGGGWYPSIYDKLHNTEKEACEYGLEYLRSVMINGIEAGKTDSCGNYNSKLINDTLREIKKLRNPCVQLELF
ncbi:hypothetical protein [Parabacteroides sp. Marseille-P3160]|uniref:hypothetical protein n=1 Tax=Parabacteroides sp. Marseille-P3160 TaxID=1917887 RepID=UPI0009BAC73D|nr:hypothetical protein [Parabacteroides sp. Marseille-P3160]